MRYKERGKFLVRPELTPLVDVVLILLIFFSLSSTFLLFPGIRVDLPNTSFPWKREKEEIRITLTYDNLLFLEGKRIEWGELPSALHRFSLERKNPLLVIQADKNALHGRVIKIMDIAREAGIRKFAIACEKKREK